MLDTGGSENASCTAYPTIVTANVAEVAARQKTNPAMIRSHHFGLVKSQPPMPHATAQIRKHVAAPIANEQAQDFKS